MSIALAHLAIIVSTGLESPTVDWHSKVAPSVLDAAATSEVEFLIVLSDQADVRESARLGTKEAKGRFVFEALRSVAAESQGPLVSALESEGLEHRDFWVTNMVWTRGDLRALERIARRSDVARIEPNARGDIRDAATAESGEALERPIGTVAGPEWNITRVDAPSVWAAGVIGEGAVVGAIDTGFEWTHPTIVNQYRGWDGVSANHDYNWYDAIHDSSSGPCTANSPEPCDDHGHGTHIVGTMVGDDGAGNQIGVAPGAEWIGCRCWEPIRRSDVSYVSECLQWMLAPTDRAGMNPDPAKAPHAINNSWVCEPSEGCGDVNVLRTIVENLRAAGVVVLAGAGNDGPGCGTIWYPPAIYDASLTVGATRMSEAIAGFSSRGPATVDGSGRLKPDVTAPGVDIRSAFPGGGYMVWDGTSTAGPHVAGEVALIVSANPALAGQVDTIEAIILNTAVPRTSVQTCGGVPGTEVPNNTFGYGRIDAFAAYQRALRFATGIASRAGEATTPPTAARLIDPPTPFRPPTTFRYELSTSNHTTLAVYDASGRRVRLLVSMRSAAPGVYAAAWDGRDETGRSVSSGVYFVRLAFGNSTDTRRLVLMDY